MNSKSSNFFNLTVSVAALGYFVDVFDTVLFGMQRIPSLRDMGYNNEELVSLGRMVDNWQMVGLLVGGLAWGIYGDRKGRVQLLFGSIIIYSLATLGSGLVNDAYSYAFMRLIAGFGLAGELGGGVTLVNEILSKEKRGLATAFIAGFGILGAVAAGILIKSLDNWRWVYYIGGIMGILLLLMRFSVKESLMFEQAKKEKVPRGDLWLIIKNKQLWTIFICLILIVMPVGYIVQLYSKYLPELALEMGLTPMLDSRLATNAMMLVYGGLSAGDLCSGYLSYILKSRKKPILIFMVAMCICFVLFWVIGIHSVYNIYVMIFLLGFFAGYWAVFTSLIAESFGTNLRATTTTAIPNILRGLVLVVNLMFVLFHDHLQITGKYSTILIGVILVGLAFWAWRQLPETYGKNLDYVDQ